MRSILKWGGIALAAVVVLACLCGAAYYVFMGHFYPDAPVADYPKPASALEAQQQDADYFARVMAMDRAFTPAERAEANRRIAALKTKLLPPDVFEVRLDQITALADNGHTHLRILGPDRVAPNLLPIRVTRFADGFTVMRAKPAYADMLGGRLESIDGMPAGKVEALIETLRGGLPEFRRENATIFLVVQDLLSGLGIAHDPMKSTWTVRLPSGALVTHTLTAAPLPKEDPFPYGFRWLSPEPVKGMSADWKSYAPAEGEQPISRRQLDRAFLDAPVAGTCARYIRLQDITDNGDEKIAPFLTAEEASLKATHPCAVIVDLRGNGGGDYTNAWHFSHLLPGLTGHIYILTDPDTFSAAITTTAFLKEAGGAKATILGEPIGDRLAFYAEGGQGCLPNSKLCATYTTGKHNYGGPCTDWGDCFWLNWFYPVRVKSLEPDEAIPQRFSDWNAGHDAAYERAMAMIKAR
ncbi:MAG TPA: hypothetical protein VGF56_01870 [Rhizomicrobium sp.]|jgi:hypothetical protein